MIAVERCNFYNSFHFASYYTGSLSAVENIKLIKNLDKYQIKFNKYEKCKI
jgi:hypothetical protein